MREVVIRAGRVVVVIPRSRCRSGRFLVAQQGQVFPMKSNRPGGTALWGYRYRTGGRGSGRVQRDGLGSEQDARESLARALARVRRANGTGTTLTLDGLVDEYLAQHDAQRETIEKLRRLLAARMLLVRAVSPLDVRM